ncbi:ATP-binding protein [Dactylosporangium vinaceum]|uniref:ATP-binding protein n=1 Tax=Dactylosporangium vinaceum TaxID=53362 RepID=UPI001FE368EB|nr:tetratricopeptide repeat protein [Dactylosporangium vinaceum]
MAVLRAEAHPARGGNLRAALTSFVGREDDVERLAAQVADRRLVTLVGPGGAGKTRLAATVAAGLARPLPDGAWLVELAPVTEAEEVPAVILRALSAGGLIPSDSGRRPRRAEPTEQLAESLAPLEVLLVLDNCEHVIGAAAGLSEELLGRCPKLRILATSREPLGILGETLFPVGPLPLPPPQPALDTALRAPSVRLLRDRAAAVRPGWTVTAANVAAVAEICRRLDGLPLAIELAAARLRSFTPEQLAARLGDRFRLLTGGNRTALPRHQTLHAVVAWSWDLLSDDERALAESLAVFPGTFDAAAAAAIAHAPESAVEELLHTLVDRSLLQIAPGAPGADETHHRPTGRSPQPAAPGAVEAHHSPAGRSPQPAAPGAVDAGALRTSAGRPLLPVGPGPVGPVRFRMLETIREFALAELGRRGAAGDVRSAHAAYFLALMEEAEPHLRTETQLEWLARVRPDQDNVHAAVGYLCDSGDVERAFRLGAASGWFWTFADNHAESALWLGRILAAGERHPAAVPPDLRVVVSSMHLVNSGFAGDFQFDPARLDDLIAQAAAAPPGGHPFVELVEPVVSLFRDDTERGTELVRARLAGRVDPWTRGMLHSVLGHLRENDGDIDGMHRELTAAVEAFRAIGERWGLAMTLASLADAQARRGDFPAAVASFEESIALHHDLGIRSSEAYLLVSRAALRRHTEGPHAARAMLRAFVEDVTQTGRDVSHAMLELGHLARADGDLPEAERLYQESWRLLQEAPLVAPQYRAIVVTARAEIDLARNDLAQARTRLQEAMALALSARDMPVVGKVAVAVSGLAAATGNLTQAAEILAAAQLLAGTRDASNTDWTTRREALRTALGPSPFKAATARGLALSREEALALVNPTREPNPGVRPSRNAPPIPPRVPG